MSEVILIYLGAFVNGFFGKTLQISVFFLQTNVCIP